MDLLVDVLKDGPNLVRGPLKFVDAGGKETVIDKSAALCRCGQSGGGGDQHRGVRTMSVLLRK